ncbi:hypothetical protein MOKP64_44990 [Mycobacterium avium subsp. hominissuis]
MASGTKTRQSSPGIDVEAPPQPRLNVNLNTLTAEALQEYRVTKGISLTEAVRRLIGIGHFIFKAQQEGKEILLKKGDETQRLVLDF